MGNRKKCIEMSSGARRPGYRGLLPAVPISTTPRPKPTKPRTPTSQGEILAHLLDVAPPLAARPSGRGKASPEKDPTPRNGQKVFTSAVATCDPLFFQKRSAS